MKIAEDKNYKKLSTFWKENGLEIEVLEKAPEEVIKAWSITAEDGQLVAAAALPFHPALHFSKGILQ